jgi:hypothetical protein
MVKQMISWKNRCVGIIAMGKNKERKVRMRLLVLHRLGKEGLIKKVT